jgi:hypothetical protein
MLPFLPRRATGRVRAPPCTGKYCAPASQASLKFMHKYHRKQGTEFHHHKNQGRAHRFWTSVPVAAEKEGAYQVKSLRQHKIPGQPPPLAKHHSKNQAPRSLLPQLLSVSTHRCRNSSPAAQAAHCMSTSTGSKAGPSSSTTRRCSPSTCGDVVLTLSTPGTKGAPAYLPTHLLCFRRFCRSISPAARAAQAA